MRVEAAVKKLSQKVRKIDETASAGKPIPRRIAGHSFAFTGKIPGWPRLKKLYPIIRRLGGRAERRVSGIKSAECLVHGDIMGGRGSTRKLREARRLGVEVINQEQFLKILNRGRPASVSLFREETPRALMYSPKGNIISDERKGRQDVEEEAALECQKPFGTTVRFPNLGLGRKP